MKQVIKGITAALMIGAGSNAIAGPQLELQFPSGNEIFPEGSQNLHITLHTDQHVPVTRHVSAGLLRAQLVSSTDFDETSLYKNDDNILAYCVDVLNDLVRARTVYEVKEVPSSDTSGNPSVTRNFDRALSFIGAINYLLNNPGSVTGASFAAVNEGNKNWLNPNTPWMSAAIQLGIWEALYEKTDTDLSITPAADGNDAWFSSSWNNTDGKALLEAAFGKVKDGSATPVDTNIVRWIDPEPVDGVKPQGFFIDPAPVPLPGTLLLLLGGLGGLLIRRRRAAV